MSNYKWVKMSDNYAELRQEDFSSVPRLEVKDLDPFLMEKLEDNGVDYWLDGDGFLEPCRYVLEKVDDDKKFVSITAPLYEFDLDTGDFKLLEETYTDEVIDPAEYEQVKETYYRCVKEVTSEQAKIFEEVFARNSRDNGLSSLMDIASYHFHSTRYFYSQYIPEGYIKVCEKKWPGNSDSIHTVIFIKKMDAKGQDVTIKLIDSYKGLAIGKGGENIKRIAKMINAKRINVI